MKQAISYILYVIYFEREKKYSVAKILENHHAFQRVTCASHNYGWALKFDSDRCDFKLWQKRIASIQIH